MKNYLVIDTETANTPKDEKGNINAKSALVYNVGWAIIDAHGDVKVKRSFLNTDIFCGEKELMRSAYYADKIPAYWKGYRFGEYKMARFATIQKIMREDMLNYKVDTVIAHNAKFDYDALNSTIRYQTCSAERYFFPKNIDVWDSMKMAEDTICKMASYKKWCKANGYVTSRNVCRKSAEVLYRFLSKDNTFEEKHTALEDVMIEKDIVVACFKKHKPMRKELFKKYSIIDPMDMTDGRENIDIIIESEVAYENS